MMKFILALLLSVNAQALTPPNSPFNIGNNGSPIAQALATINSAFLGNGYALISSQAMFGDGSDGALVFGASGTTSLGRDMFWSSMSWPVSSTANLNFQNQRVFVNGNCDFTNAPAGALQNNGGNGGNGAAGGGGGAAGANVAAGTNLTGRAGIVGGAGGTTTGTASGVSAGGSVISNANGGNGGAGGAGGSGAGGTLRNPAVITDVPMRDVAFHWFLPQTGTGAQLFVSGGAPGGGGGGGDATSSGAGGGGGGATGQAIYLACKTITTGAGSVANTIQANGGNGGNGGTPTATCTGGCGGGGGGGGGAGGWIVVKYNNKVGATVNNFVQAAVGTCGNGGTHKNTGGVDGVAGCLSTAPTAGLIQILNLATGAFTTSTSGNASL